MPSSYEGFARCHTREPSTTKCKARRNCCCPQQDKRSGNYGFRTNLMQLLHCIQVTSRQTESPCSLRHQQLVVYHSRSVLSPRSSCEEIFNLGMDTTAWCLTSWLAGNCSGAYGCQPSDSLIHSNASWLNMPFACLDLYVTFPTCFQASYLCLGASLGRSWTQAISYLGMQNCHGRSRCVS